MLASHSIIDGFLGEDHAQRLLDMALAHESDFEPTRVYDVEKQAGAQGESRTSFHLNRPWTTEQEAFRAVVRERMEEIVAAGGSPGFAPDQMEFEMVATRDGGHFGCHIDTVTQAPGRTADRIVSAVYYFHRRPAGFTGGNLVLHALVGDETRMIEPRHDRLAVFSSIAPHEVTRTAVPGDAFEDARFSINCWLLRARK